MNYKLLRYAEGRVEFTRSRTGQYLFGVVFGVLGVPAALLGASIALVNPQLGALVAGFGLAFTGAMLLVVTRRAGPGAFAFDDGAQALLAYRSPSARGEPEGRVPYSQIADLRVGSYRNSSSEGRSTTYALDVVRRDGASWSLVNFQSKDKAERLLELVLQNVELGPTESADAPAEQPALSGHFQIEKSATQTRIRFKKPYRVVTHVSGLMVVSGLCFAVLGARYDVPPVAFYLVMALLSFALAALLFAVVNGVGKHVVLTICPQSLRAQEEGGVIKAWFEDPITALHAVRLGFRPNHDDRALLLLKRDEYDALSRCQQGSYTSALEVGLALLSVRKLEVGELSLIQKLELEQLIEAEVERVAHKRLL